VNRKATMTEKKLRPADAVNRKLIRPNMSDIRDRFPGKGPWRKQSPPDQTNAEAFYYLKQMNARTPMVFVMKDGEVVHGVIEWYDRKCLKVNRHNNPNLLVMKDSLKYVYKDGNNGRG
jgi:host factor-I protein